MQFSLFQFLGLTLLAVSGLTAQTNDGPLVFGSSNSAEWGRDNPTLWPVLQEAGVQSIREFPEWQSIQPAKDVWKWDGAEFDLSLARKCDLSVFGVLFYLTPWASSGGDTRTFPIKDPQDFGTYAGACVGKYKDSITYWEIWNEFNSPVFARNGTPKQYAELLRTAFTEAKKVNPACKIGMGSADVGYSFFEQVIKEGGAGHFDFLAVHPYSMMQAVASGREEALLVMSDNLRALLKKNGQPADMEIVVSEMGITIPDQPEAEAMQAAGLIKAHTLCFAQGINRVYWFEGRGPDYGKGKTFGLLRRDWSKRPSWFALKTMIGLFGKDARRIGWFNPTGQSYGFLFQGAAGPVLVMWADGEKDTVTFPGQVTVTDLAGQAVPIENGKVELTGSPLFITGLPDAVVATVKGNSGKPFPWLKNYSEAESVSIVMGASNVESGLTQLEQGDGKTVTALVDGIYPRRPNRNPYMYFDVDDSYASVGDHQLEITVIAQPTEPAKGASFGLTYESTKGYKDAKGRFNAPKNSGWQSYTFKLDDANFGGTWGWNFRLEHAQGAWIREVKVKRIGAKM